MRTISRSLGGISKCCDELRDSDLMPTSLTLKKMREETKVTNTTEIFGALELKLIPESILDKHLFDRADDLDRAIPKSRHCSRLLSRSHTSSEAAGPPARIKRCR